MNSFNLLIYVIFITISKDSIEAFVGVGDYPGNDINNRDCGRRYTTEYIYLDYVSKCFLNKYKPKMLIKVKGGYELKPFKEYPKSRIRFGTYATYAEAPWAVYIIRTPVESNGKSEFSCNGVLITFEWILSTASCLNDTGFAVTVHAGSQLKQGLEVRDHGRVFLHPLFNDKSSTLFVQRSNDIALFKAHKKFDKKIDRNQLKINPICLPTRTRYNANYEWASYFAFKNDPNEKKLITSKTRLWPKSQCTFPEWPNLFCSKYNLTYVTDAPDVSDFGAGLVYYMEKYRFRAVLLGPLTTYKLNIYRDMCRFGGAAEKVMCAGHWVPVPIHIDWILSTINSN